MHIKTQKETISHSQSPAAARRERQNYCPEYAAWGDQKTKEIAHFYPSVHYIAVKEMEKALVEWG